MFRGGQPNPYDDIVAKTTDENLTAENWELILNLCDKVQEEGEQGARNVIAASLKRLAHRNPNVQLYTLTLVEALSKNCGIEVHREISSRAFTQGLEKLITDRTTHDKVRKRALASVAIWTAEFEKDPTLGLMEECYENLKSKGYKFETPNEPPPPDVDDEVRRREEEELQRVLELSMQDKGGRSQWEAYSLASSSGAGGSGAGGSGAASSSSAAGPSGSSSRPAQSAAQQPPTYGGYVPSSSTPAVSAVDTSPSSVSSATITSPSPSSVRSSQEGIPIVTRVRAMHTFEPTEPGELAFEKGDIIKVVDRNYKDWWRGQLKGRTGIFPVNYVEPLPEPTAAEIAREAEQEAAVFSQAANVDRLLMMLRNMDPARDNLADNEEIQELYRSCMSLRPKIVKLIDKYSQKRADLVSMNETFVKARTIFDRMMEESLARHTGVYDGRPGYVQTPSQSYIGRPDSRARQDYLPPGGPPVAPGGPQAYGWNPNVYEQPGYNAYPAAPAAYPPPAEAAYPPPHGPPPTQPSYGDLNAYPGARPQSVYSQAPPQGYPGPSPYGPPVDPPPGPHVAPEPTPQPQIYPQPGVQPEHHQPQVYPQPSVQPEQQVQPQYQAQPQPQPQAQQQAQAQVQVQPQSQAQGQVQPQPQPQAQAQAQAQEQPLIQQQSVRQASPQPQQQQQSGPPYVYDPNTTYADPNVQAWAQYYAHGGTDPTGSVYFVSVPGVKEGPPAGAPAPARTQSGDSVGTQDSTTTLGAEVTQTAPLHINKAQPADQPQPGAYGVSPYANAGPTSPVAGEGPPVTGQPFYGLTNQFAGMDIGDGRQNGQQGVGASA
ncbi:hypothetical protein C8T65DRAFT_827856 [Cerioporus squamosus]|nr:hypothetical protein C8T65DRAFT_827856 [Cerioporus squamosus]